MTALRWRQIAVGPCPRCRAAVLAGTDRDRAALDVATDPYPLTWAGELAARDTGRRTYHVTPAGLYARIMPAAKAGSHPVVADHECGQPIPREWRAPLPAPRPQPPAETDSPSW